MGFSGSYPLQGPGGTCVTMQVSDAQSLGSALLQMVLGYSIFGATERWHEGETLFQSSHCTDLEVPAAMLGAPVTGDTFLPWLWNWMVNGGVFHLLLGCSSTSEKDAEHICVPALFRYLLLEIPRETQATTGAPWLFLLTQVYDIPQVGQRSFYGVKSDLKKE